MQRLTLSGRNNTLSTRIVYLDNVEIGEVIPTTLKDWGQCWEARDTCGQSHGHWLTDWYAADALTRVLRGQVR